MAQNTLRLVEDNKAVDKSKALDAALSQIERAFGKGSIMRLGSNENVVEVETVSTGSLSLDIALGIGGLPKGRIIEIYGPESSGKDDAGAADDCRSPEKGWHLRFRRRRTRARPGLCPQARRRPRKPPDLPARHR
jgi:recombination protein RecA